MKDKIRKRYNQAGFDNSKFDTAWKEYENLPSFKINENVLSS